MTSLDATITGYRFPGVGITDIAPLRPLDAAFAAAAAVPVAAQPAFTG